MRVTLAGWASARSIMAAVGLMGCLVGAHPANAQRAQAPAFSWTGFYIGANAGGGWSDAPSTTFSHGNLASRNLLFNVGLYSGLLAAPVPNPIDSADASGFVGGAQIGYNYQINSLWIVGVEADFQGSSVSGDNVSLLPNPGLNNTSLSTDRNLDWFATVRGRIGVTPIDRLFVYGTGGVAIGREKASFAIVNNGAGFATGILPDGSSVICDAASVCVGGSNTRTSVGWTAGGGAELAVSKNVTIKAEYLYLGLGSQAVQMTAPNPSGVNNPSIVANVDRSGYHILRAGLNWRFTN